MMFREKGNNSLNCFKVFHIWATKVHKSKTLKEIQSLKDYNQIMIS